jgi:hypothetical protein
LNFMIRDNKNGLNLKLVFTLLCKDCIALTVH